MLPYQYYLLSSAVLPTKEHTVLPYMLTQTNYSQVAGFGAAIKGSQEVEWMKAKNGTAKLIYRTAPLVKISFHKNGVGRIKATDFTLLLVSTSQSCFYFPTQLNPLLLLPSTLERVLCHQPLPYCASSFNLTCY